MNRQSRGNQRRSSHSNRQRTLYVRATAVVVKEGKILLVKHNRENQWALPGGRVTATEEPSRRAVLEVAEETGLLIDNPIFVGRYAGTVAAHQIFLAQGNGDPKPNRRELRDVCWWDGKTPLDVEQHVNAIMAIVRNWVKENAPDELDPGQADIQALPELKQLVEGFEDAN
ncbi:MAG: NUDIX domain-containing protein [Chloroflexota bacterium]|nr:NUDIX domain-containing protein [Chloroflexota bacterium]